MSLRRRGACAAAALVLLAACGGSSDDTSVTTLPPDTATVLAAAGAAMQDLESVRFDITLTGAPLILSDLLDLRSVTGQWTAPGSSQAILGFKAGGITVEIASITIDGTQWATNPVSGAWDRLPPGFSFDPAVLFDDETGWQALLAENLDGAVFVGTEETEAGTQHRIMGRASGERIETITQGFAGSEPVDVELWVDVETAFLTQLSFATPSDDGLTEWSLLLAEFNEPVTIDPPPETG